MSSRREWREWLSKNHDRQSQGLWLLFYKKSADKPTIEYDESVEEALCFGWIDTTIKRLDENRFTRSFSKRNKNSRWSDNTISYAKELIKKGKMTPTGLEFYKLGLKKPTHDHGIPKNPDMPSELEQALNKNRSARENFNNFPPSTKKMIYRWILRGKLPETRLKRINITIKAALKGNKNIF